MIQIRRLSTGAFLGLAIFAAISTAHALSIGRVRGAVLMGRPLNLTLPLVLDADEPEPCIAGDLFHGDTRVSRMSLAQERAPGGGHQIRLTSPVPVDEPIVTLYLRVGCGEKMTRRFVLLAEQEDVAPLSGPATVAVPAQSVDAQASPVAPRVAGTASAAAEPRASTSPRIRPPSSIDAATAPAAPAPRTERAPRAERASRAQASRSPRVDTPAAVASPNLRRENNISRSPRVAPPTSSAEAARSRLRVEPLDLSPVPNTGLRPSLTLSTPTGSPQKRAEALAMWQALNTTPDEFLRQHQRIAAMEAQVKGLRDSMQQNTLAMNQLAQQLEKARGERNTLSLALVALGVVSAVALAAWFWRRRPSRNSSRRWWQDSDRGLSADSVFTPESSSGSHDKPAVTAPVAAGPAQPRATQSPRETVSRSVQLSSLDSRPGSRASSFDSSPSRPPDFAHSQTMSTRMIKAEELIDIQQQAEFFASIGQHDQAAAVLEAHVHDHVETSPAAWMDLLEIYHGLGRRADYERIRSEFLALFNAQVPTFEEFGATSSGLEDYRRAMSRIIALWPSPRVLEVIEESIFRRPNSPGAEPFDLEAYRDLLLLYNVAKEVTTGDSMAPVSEAPRNFGDSQPVSGFGATSLQPLSGSIAEARLDAPLEFLQQPPTSASVGLDIDLEALPPPEPESVELPPLEFDLDSLKKPGQK